MVEVTGGFKGLLASSTVTIRFVFFTESIIVLRSRGRSVRMLITCNRSQGKEAQQSENGLGRSSPAVPCGTPRVRADARCGSRKDGRQLLEPDYR
jgi:hypothetical protein